MLILYYRFGPSKRAQNDSGGEGGIRTLEGLSTLTPLAGERFQPLSHLSDPVFSGANSGTTSFNAVGSGVAALAVFLLKVSPHQPLRKFSIWPADCESAFNHSATSPIGQNYSQQSDPAKGAHLTEWVTGGKAAIRD